MKTKLFLVSYILVQTALSLSPIQTLAVEPSTPLSPSPDATTVVSVVPEVVFIPTGFDSKDNAQFMISGYYPNTCYKVAPLKSQVDHETHVIQISNLTYFKTTDFCAQMLVHYDRQIELGALEPGGWTIQF